MILCPAPAAREVVFGRLEVMLLGRGPAVADPRADDIRREGFLQFGLPRRPEVVEELGPQL